MPAESTLPRSVEAGPHDARRGPALFRVLSAPDLGQPGARHLLDGLAGVTVGRGGAPAVERARRGDAVWLVIGLDDRRVSASHARLVPTMHRWTIEDVGSRNGTFVNGDPIARAVLVDGDVVEVGDTFFVFRDAVAHAGPPDAGPVAHAGLTTLDPDLGDAFERMTRVASVDETVVIHGESGTGKELVARAIHAASGRSGPFVAVNCGALPETIAEAELFGHRRGAFSGAVGDRLGLIRSAVGGTLFLDEIGDLRLASQAALLRVLQERQVTPLGSDTPVDVDIRVVCATHRSLDALVAEGEFRDDLLARLRGFTVTLPPLRDRRFDLGGIIAALLARLRPDQAAPTISAGAARALLLHDWPHNVRELEKALTTALALAEGGPLQLEHLPERMRGQHDAPSAPPPPPGTPQPRRDRLVALLREHHGNIAAVARVLGKARTQIHRWLERYGIDPDQYRS